MSGLMLSGLETALKRGELIPVLGAGIFQGAHDRSGVPLPFDSHSLILALNNNRPMPPRLMLEYPRAAMQIEQRRGRSVLEGLFARIYDAGFEPLAIQRAIADLVPPVVVDLNRDGGLQELYGRFSHTLLVGTARIAGDAPRYQLYDYQGGDYQRIDSLERLDKPLLIKPMGALAPERSLILSDADFVDWLTEAVAGFALPPVFKDWRKKRDWLFLGCRFERDTDRMVARELAGELSGGYWLFEATPTKAETRFIQTHNLTIIPASLAAFLGNGDG